MPDPVLRLLEYVFLAVLYLFFLRVLRAVWVEMREPKPAPATPVPAPTPAAAAPTAAVPLATPRRGIERLVAVDPPERRGREFVLDENEMTVGRAGGCAVLLDDDSFVSQLHARLYRRDGEMWVEDLGSTNGTFLNRQRVTGAAPLRKGDVLQFGRTTFEVAK